MTSRALAPAQCVIRGREEGRRPNGGRRGTHHAQASARGGGRARGRKRGRNSSACRQFVVGETLLMDSSPPASPPPSPPRRRRRRSRASCGEEKGRRARCGDLACFWGEAPLLSSSPDRRQTDDRGGRRSLGSSFSLDIRWKQLMDSGTLGGRGRGEHNLALFIQVV